MFLFALARVNAWLCVCVRTLRLRVRVGAPVLTGRLVVLKVRGTAAIASNLKDTTLEQAPLQMDPLR